MRVFLDGSFATFTHWHTISVAHIFQQTNKLQKVCLINISNLSADINNFPNRTIQFLSQLHKKQINVVNISSETNLTIHFPQTCIGSKLCIFILQAKHPLKLNISLHNQVYIGVNNTQECIYAGLATYDHTADRFIHTNTFCVVDMFVSSSNVSCFREKTFSYYDSAFLFNYSSPHWYRQPYLFTTWSRQTCSLWEIYSKAHKMLFVFYSYQEYGSLQIDISAKTTFCAVLHFDQCKIGTRSVLLPWNQTCSLFIFTNKGETFCNRKLLTYFEISFASESAVRKNMSIVGYGEFKGL